MTPQQLQEQRLQQERLTQLFRLVDKSEPGRYLLALVRRYRGLDTL